MRPVRIQRSLVHAYPPAAELLVRRASARCPAFGHHPSRIMGLGGGNPVDGEDHAQISSDYVYRCESPIF